MVELTTTAPTGQRARVATDLRDRCGRRIDHLRLSVTSKCHLRCVYCMPAYGVPLQDATDDWDDQQRVAFVRLLRERYGLTQVRITGGEPLLHRKIVSLVASLKSSIPGISLAMTTNGRLLYQMGVDLYRAGLDRLNISLDSLDPACYRRITGATIDHVLEGMESARFVGFPPPKINTVVLRGLNDGEIADLACWAWKQGSEIRFLEAMPIGPAAEGNRRAFVSAAEIRAKLAERFNLEPLPRRPGETAQRFRASNDSCQGIVGLISPVSESFCADCRRMRLTADGKLYPCLLDDRCVDLRSAWSEGRLDGNKMNDLVRAAVNGKQAQGSVQTVSMIKLGG